MKGQPIRIDLNLYGNAREVNLRQLKWDMLVPRSLYDRNGFNGDNLHGFKIELYPEDQAKEDSRIMKILEHDVFRVEGDTFLQQFAVVFPWDEFESVMWIDAKTVYEMGPGELEDAYIDHVCCSIADRIDPLEQDLRLLSGLHDEFPFSLDPDIQAQLMRVLVLLEKELSR